MGRPWRLLSPQRNARCWAAGRKRSSAGGPLRPKEAPFSPLPGQCSTPWLLTFSTHFLNAYFCCVHSWARKHLWLFKTGVLVKSEVSSKKPSPQDRMACPGKAGRRGGGAEMSSEAVAWVVSCSGAPLRPCLWGSRTRRWGPQPSP